MKKLFLPMFLFRVGLLTLIYMDSVIILVKPCPSLPTMLKLSMVVRWPVVVWWLCIGEGAFRCSLYLCSNVVAISPMHSSLHSTLSNLYQYIIQLLHCIRSLSFDDTSMFLITLLPLKYVLMPYLPHMPLVLLQRAHTYNCMPCLCCCGCC